jgi:arsenate reductase (thioredoxin)
MAEGLLRALGGDRFEAHSAGSQATEVRPLAIRAMGELGIDISGQRSKTTDAFVGQEFDEVISVCDEAKEACPYFPGAARRRNWSFEDPAAASGTEDERLKVFRRVRDAIADRVRAELVRPASPPG